MLPDLNSIALFVKAAELQSLTRAAESSGMGLAAASRRIALLEHRLKSKLFDRTPQGVQMTSAGKLVLRHAKHLLIQLNQMQADLDEHHSGRKNVLRIQANTSVMAQHLPADIARFSLLRPDITLTMKERWSKQIVDALRLGEADVGIINASGSLDGLECCPYRHDHLCAVLPNNHPLAKHDELQFIRVLDYPIVGLEHGSSLMHLLTTQAGIAEKPLKLHVQMQGFEAVCRMIEAGMGLGVLPQHAAQAYLPGMKLQLRPLTDKWAHREMLICTALGREKTEPLNAFVSSLTQAKNIFPDLTNE
ncbi:LysR family transcriptional regulator [Alcaligenes sp. 13f]|uniref:LysR family transcriptional regulator n=1 Tax=Alcaligenes sp. 13f TaxID=2841924 RepID=UPI001CF6C48C|nr:LysR family transcriptional regulator [Alcaligenes sp. 13f]MCB4321981.1 LysR family transcriptional regulator [Alcaligenes sp. 13f]